MRLVGCACFLASLLVFDIATPLLPGAYQFDPDDSIEALRTRSSRAGAQTLDRQSVPVVSKGTQVIDPERLQVPHATLLPAVRLTAARWRLPRGQAAEAPSPLSEDH